jgi:subtilisin family serine protease
MQPHRRLLHATLALVLILAVVIAAGLLITRPAYAQEGPDADQPFRIFLPAVGGSNSAPPESGAVIPGQYIVVLKTAEQRAASAPDGVAISAAAFAQQVVMTYGGEILYTYEDAISGFAGRLSDEAVTALGSAADVAYIEADTVVVASQEPVAPTGDALDGDMSTEAWTYPATWGLDRIDQRTLPLNLNYGYFRSGRGVIAYIIDTGVRATSKEFVGRVLSGYTAISDGYGTNDCNGHGTHVAGTVAGSTYGVAKQALVRPVRVLGCSGSGSTSGVIAGVNYVRGQTYRPAVANMSLGGTPSTALDSAVNSLINSGVTVVVAAGNDNANACGYSPARVANAITVGSTTSTDARASTSNYGSCLDLFAPGANITSASHLSDGGTRVLSGTSMASPHVAGAAALYLQTSPTASPGAVRNILVSNATVNRVINPGSGSPNRLLYTGAFGAPSSCSQRINNYSFESGRLSYWSESSNQGYNLVGTRGSFRAPIYPSHGAWMAWLSGANSDSSQIVQSVVMPSGPSSLSYWYYIQSSDACGYDYGYVQLTAGSTTYTLRAFNLCSSQATSGWHKDIIPLSASFGGQTVLLRFRSATDSSLISSFFVDNVQLYSGAVCVAEVGEVDVSALPGVLADGTIEPKPDGPDPLTPRQQE